MGGEGGREGRKEGGRVGMGREAEGGMMEEGSKIGREGGREGEWLKLGGGGCLRRGSGMSNEERIYKAGFKRKF